MNRIDPSCRAREQGLLAGRVALITGAASGIGRAASLLFSEEGAQLIGLDVDGGALDQLASHIVDRGGDMIAYHGDAGVEHDVSAALSRGFEHFGHIDILYANAGVFWDGVDRSVTETEVSVWNSVVSVNLGGPFLLTKHGVPRLQESGGGSIILTGSISALAGFPVAQDAYTSSKGALASLMRSLAVQFAPDNIRCNIIHPGMISTPMQEPRLQDPAWVRAVENTIPLRRFGTPEEIARVALFLASDLSSYMTGSELVADGGFTAR